MIALTETQLQAQGNPRFALKASFSINAVLTPRTSVRVVISPALVDICQKRGGKKTKSVTPSLKGYDHSSKQVLPSQVLLSLLRMNPSRQLKTWAPRVFVQFAFGGQMLGFQKHSSISKSQ